MNGQQSRAAQAGRFLSLLVTNSIKIGGLYVALTAAARPVPDALVMAVSVFMMAGAQISEDMILRLVDRMFGKRDEHAS